MTQDISNVLTIDQQREIITEWIGGGSSAKELGKKHNVSTRTINLLVTTSSPTRLMIEKEMVKIPAARENAKIAEIKYKVLEFYSDVMDEVKDEALKVKYTKDVNELFNNMDRVARLNAGEATDRTEHTERVLDIAEISKTLKTDDDKKDFLLKQIQK